MAAIRTFHLDLLFLGVHGISERGGFTTPNLMEADTDRALVAAAEKLIVLADHSKWDLLGISTIAALPEAHVVITDSGLSRSAQETLREAVGELILAG